MLQRHSNSNINELLQKREWLLQNLLFTREINVDIIIRLILELQRYLFRMYLRLPLINDVRETIQLY